jgi:hypothetical protein
VTDYSLNDSFLSFIKSPLSSTKHTNYFPIYDHIFKEYRNKPITFVEIGILNGGSLFMWRNFFGPNARIIGIDFNPSAKKHMDSGFEIYIGDQGNEEFWKHTLALIGQIDILLDDGGHTFNQQIVTVNSVLPYVKDGGILVTEDTMTSYLSGFGPRKYTFIKFVKNYIDRINLRSQESVNMSESIVWSIQIFSSIVVFYVNRNLASMKSERIYNIVSQVPEIDFRYHSNKFVKFVYTSNFYKLLPTKFLVNLPKKLPSRAKYKKYFKNNAT